jgi:hypothetical protein
LKRNNDKFSTELLLYVKRFTYLTGNLFHYVQVHILESVVPDDEPTGSKNILHNLSHITQTEMFLILVQDMDVEKRHQSFVREQVMMKGHINSISLQC